MNLRHDRHTSILGLLAALLFAAGGCGGNGTDTPSDSGTDAGGDGGQVECVTANDCDDGNVCTDDQCVNGDCVYTNNTAPCDDGQTCSTNDTCVNGVCVGDTTLDCDDDNPCTTDSCDDEEGCVHLPNSASCDDGDPCTVGDVCAEGACTAGEPRDCSGLDDQCNTGVCQPATGDCVAEPVENGTACDDGQECSTNDYCSNGVCIGETTLDCDDDNPCTEDSCDDTLGCVHSYNHAPCDDNNACTVDDVCSQGRCTGGAPLDCDDGNACTSDTCDPATGCVNTNNTDPCDDGDACTVGDTCADGACQPGNARDCDDSNVCTDDSCDTTLGCVYANNNADCDDGNPCTEGDQCSGGACQPGTSAFDCDDDNPCTDDSCDPDAGCTHTNNTDACDDGDPCTMDDVCANGSCDGVPLDADDDGFVADGCPPGGDDCDDGNANINPGVFEGGGVDAAVCSDGIDNDCDGLTDTDPACAECTDDADCDDDNVCNGQETCSGGQCQAGTALVCDDDNVCTDDSCHPQNGCQNTNNTANCDDGDPCTVGDQCAGGSCQPGTDILTCNDSNPCTDDECVAGTGCVYTNDDTNTCDDGDPCTDNDFCSAGACQPGPDPLDCDDGNDCTDDECVAGQGCVNTEDDTNTCDDASACTENDHCSGGSCVGSSVVCDDGNPCTYNECDPETGCTYPPNDEATCDDGDACTVNDRCFDGNCVGDIRDRDEDTYPDELCGGDDCDDLDATVNPGAEELCGDGIDNDCDDITDEGCATCDAVDPDAELIVDNDNPFYIMPLNVDEEALNLFFAEAAGYNVLQVKVAFYDASGGSGTGQGDYSAHIFAADPETGLPGQELGASSVDTVAVTWPDAWHTFTFSEPISMTQGQAFWVAIRSAEDQTENAFTPLLDGGVLCPYVYGVAYFDYEGTLDYYMVGGNFLIRVEGCAEGPWLEMSDRTVDPAVVSAGGNADIDTTLYNRGFADTADVMGTLSCDDDKVTVTEASADYGVITTGGSQTNSPAYELSTDATAYGIYSIGLESTDGAGTWYDGFGLYVQGTGCTTDNYTMTTDNGLSAYVAPAADDQLGNYYVVESTSYTMTSVDVHFYRNSGPYSAGFRVGVYSYRSGKPDELLWQSDWASISGDQEIIHSYSLPTPLTFRQGNTFWVMVEAQSSLEGTEFGVLIDDGEGNSWMNGVIWDDSEGAWFPFGSSWIIRPHGCQATELRYDSHTTSPADVSAGDTADITVTLANDGATDATGVSAVMTSTDADVTVTTDSADYGTVPAEGTAASQTPYVVQVASGADEYQYLLDLEITDGVDTWYEVVPLRLAGGQVDLAFSEFTTSLAGNDLHYNFTVVNQGNVDCITPFRVDLYIDEESVPSPGQDGDWNDTIDFLGVGEQQNIQLVLEDAPAGSYDAYVQVDTLEAVAESDETNNVEGPSSQTVGSTDVFELIDPERKWFDADMPVGFRFVSGNSQPGMTQTEARDAVRYGFQHWEDVDSASITFSEESETSNAGYVYDYHNTMTFNDPDGDLGTGTLAANLPYYTTAQTVVTNGVTFYRMTDADIVFNDGVNFGTHAEAQACASDVFDTEGVATHEQGHLLGLDHPPVADATMYYTIGYCDPTRTSLEQSDINGVTFIYP